jgi:hypothetical protein
MKKLIGVVLTAAVALSPASAAFADRDDDREDRRRSRRDSSCTLDLGVLTRTVDAQAFCGRERSGRPRESTRRRRSGPDSCTLDLGVLTRTVSARALCSRR